jgi:succinylarginine dihydrolase
VSPSADTNDGRVHFTPANLSTKLHRAIEHEETRRSLSAIFSEEKHFRIHHALPGTPALGDEGAANHTRFCNEYGEKGVEFFVYGRSEYAQGSAEPKRYPARQSLEASRAVARLHGLSDDAIVFAQQLPDVIDAGVFHNDVIAVGNRNTLFCHQRAFLDQGNVYDQLRAKLDAHGGAFTAIEVPEDEVSVADAVSSYLFNSQLLTRPDGRQVLVVPQECRENSRVAKYLDSLHTRSTSIDDVLVFDLRESMKNGGGPACLRLRVVLNETERVAVNPGVWMNDTLFAQLDAWIDRHYRDRIAPADLADLKLLDESRAALDALTGILKLGAIYDFQR